MSHPSVVRLRLPVFFCLALCGLGGCGTGDNSTPVAAGNTSPVQANSAIQGIENNSKLSLKDKEQQIAHIKEFQTKK